MLLLMKFSFKALTICDNVVLYVFISPDFLFKSYLTFSRLVLLLTYSNAKRVVKNDLSICKNGAFKQTASLEIF